MRSFFLFLSLLFSTISFAFDSYDSALDFVYEYSSDTIWGCKLPENFTYRVGVIEHDIDAIVNDRHTESDTFPVPLNHYAFFITTPENLDFGGDSPLVSYLFLSKEDSSYIVIDTVGDPERYTKWDMVRTDGRLLKNQAISDLSNRIDYYTQTENSIYDVYLIEDTTNLHMIDCADFLRKDIDLENAWTFVIDTHNGSCLCIKYYRDRNENIIVSNMIAASINTTSNFSSINGFKLVLSNPNGVSTVNAELYVTLFPNPASNMIYINLDNCSLSLLSIEGETLKIANGNQMSIEEFQSGLYLLKIQKDNFSITKEIFKE